MYVCTQYVYGDTSGDGTNVRFKVVTKSLKGLLQYNYSIANVISIAEDLDLQSHRA